uniref:Uncharacterized protein n=1 Tax=Spumella elongata TaxID=89044 RepID=A0A7S3HDU9_9STRA
MDAEEFILSLKCFGLSGDAESALNYYKAVVASRPELQNVQSVHALLISVKGSKPIALEAIELYHAALLDTTHFPTLRSETAVATTVLATYVSLSPHYTNPQQLDQAVALANMLAEAGVSPDAGFYSRLIDVYSVHNNYPHAKQVYTDFIASDPDVNNAIETSMLRAAFAAGEYADCMAVYQRLISGETSSLTDKNVEILLRMSNHAGMNDLTLDVLKRWHAQGGALTWRMCSEILKAGLDTAMLKHLSEGASKPARGQPPTAQEIQAKQSLTPAERQAMRSAKRRFNDDMFTYVYHTVTLVKQSLFQGKNRALYKSFHAVAEEYEPRRSNGPNGSVPLDVLTRVAALVIEKSTMGLEMLLDRIELPSEVFPSQDARKKAHVMFVHSLARDLVVLNRWRELQALTVRVESYRHASDALRYTPAERAYVEVCTVACLLRDARDDLAAHALSTRLVACFSACTTSEETHDTVLSILQALDAVNGGRIVHSELAQVLAQCVPRLNHAAAHDLVTEALLSAVVPHAVAMYLCALAEGVNATAGSTRGPAFQLSEKEIDLIEVVLRAPHDAKDASNVEKARKFMQKLCPPPAGV